MHANGPQRWRSRGQSMAAPRYFSHRKPGHTTSNLFCACSFGFDTKDCLIHAMPYTRQPRTFEAAGRVTMEVGGVDPVGATPQLLLHAVPLSSSRGRPRSTARWQLSSCRGTIHCWLRTLVHLRTAPWRRSNDPRESKVMCPS